MTAGGKKSTPDQLIWPNKDAQEVFALAIKIMKGEPTLREALLQKIGSVKDGELFKKEIYHGAGIGYSLDIHRPPAQKGKIYWAQLVLDRYAVSNATGQLTVDSNGRFIFNVGTGQITLDLSDQIVRVHEETINTDAENNPSSMIAQQREINEISLLQFILAQIPAPDANQKSLLINFTFDTGEKLKVTGAGKDLAGLARHAVRELKIKNITHYVQIEDWMCCRLGALDRR